MHGIEAGRAAPGPERGLDRAACEDRPVGRDMAQDQPFAGTCENHVMFADDVAALSQRLKESQERMTGEIDTFLKTVTNDDNPPKAAA